MKLINTILFGLISVGLIACTASTSAKESTKDRMSRLSKETKVLIDSASCSSNNQCQSIGFGHKACGGFSAYRIYSNMNTDTSLLKSKVKRYNVLSKELNKKNNLVSNCMMLMQPQLACKQQICTIK